MKLGNTVWACDRCGAQKTQDANASHIPVGWQRIALPAMDREREVCARCLNSFRSWWYAAMSDATLEALSK